MKRTTILLAAIVAVGLTGSAYAAGRYVITSTGQIKPSVLKQLRGNRGPRGLTGRQGTTGATAPPGPTGAQGAPGSDGASRHVELPNRHGDVVRAYAERALPTKPSGDRQRPDDHDQLPGCDAGDLERLRHQRAAVGSDGRPGLAGD